MRDDIKGCLLVGSAPPPRLIPIASSPVFHQHHQSSFIWSCYYAPYDAMRSIEDSRKRWTALFCDNNTPSDLRAALKSEQGNICSDGLRSICWKAFLLFDDLDRTQWLQKIHDSRSAYSALREHFLKYIEHPDDLESTIDPLADDEESPWQTLRRDEQMRADISQDVDRCLQENFFFREPATKAKMTDVLFIYTKLNPDLGYRQGMHELLAPILWVVDRDAIDPSSLEKDDNDDDLMLHLMDASYVEHDSFTLFCSVMQTARVYYEHGEQRSASGTIDVIPIVHRCQYIHQDILSVADLELADHLQALEILPQIFLTRWMRLLFGREFPFDDMLVMWDHLFAEGLRPELVDFVCIAMLLRIRWQLLAADGSSAFTLLLRYPSPHPYAPYSFVYDGIYLEQNPTAERGRFIISKYSGKPPEFSRRPSQTSLKPPSGRRAPLLSDWRDSSEGSSPARSSGRNSAKGLETIFQDVSEGIQRRTETWGVAKAVRGAVTEARRNMQTMQSEANPRMTRYDGGSSSNGRTNASWSQEAETAANLRMRVDDLEERNRLLAKSLSQSLNDLRSHMMNMNAEKVDTSTTAAMKQALTRVQSVQTCLEDSSTPLHSIPDPEGKEVKKEGNDQTPPIIISSTNKDAPEKTSSSSTTPNEPPTKVPGLKAKTGGPPKSIPLRGSPRPSLANSEFSWMLGGNQNHRSSFVSSASVPPEQARLQSQHQALFGVGEEEKKGSKRTTPVEPDELAMRSLRGEPEGLERYSE